MNAIRKVITEGYRKETTDKEIKVQQRENWYDFFICAPRHIIYIWGWFEGFVAMNFLIKNSLLEIFLYTSQFDLH